VLTREEHQYAGHQRRREHTQGSSEHSLAAIPFAVATDGKHDQQASDTDQEQSSDEHRGKDEA
jgi:hypothetical protein